jgi:hypothetical protein
MVVRWLGRAVLTLPNIRRRTSNSWVVVRDTFLHQGDHLTLTNPLPPPMSPPMCVVVRWLQEVFENYRIVFTVGTSVTSILTAWAGMLLLLPAL